MAEHVALSLEYKVLQILTDLHPEQELNRPATEGVLQKPFGCYLST